jgi:hypothetical protein
MEKFEDMGRDRKWNAAQDRCARARREFEAKLNAMFDPERQFGEPSEREIEIRAWFLIAVLAAILWGLALAVAYAEPKGEMPPGVLPEHGGWFHQPRIQACCSTADGYAISQYEIAGDHYRVPHPERPGEWIDVPNEAVVWNQGNPTAYAWLWLYPESFSAMAGKVRCFVPAGGA